MQVIEHLNTLGKWGQTDPRVFQLIRHSGFEHFLNLPFKGIQHPVQLLTALLKGYTLDSGFVFGNEKFSLTLEDVLYVTGLPIDGHPVAVTDVSASAQDNCMKYLGAHLPMKGTHISLTSLKTMFESVPTNANAETVEWHARAKLLYVIGCVLSPNKDSTVSVQYLPFLANLEEVHHYAWGAALLSYLLSSLEPKGKSVKGCAQLLVIFFLLRVKPIRAKITPELIAKEFPLLKACTTSISGFCRHGEHMRKDEWDNILSNLEDTDVEWRPYGSIILPPHLTEQLRIARCRTALICLDTVVVQRPDISPKQFGFEEEDVRGGFAAVSTINTKAKRGRKSVDGTISQAVENWINRLNLFAFIEGSSLEAQGSEALPQQFESLRLDCDLKEENVLLREENVFLKEKCNSLQEYSSSILEENQSLQRENSSIVNENHLLQKENSSIVKENHLLQKENRNLMNQIHDLKGKIRLYCRVGPGQSNPNLHFSGDCLTVDGHRFSFYKLFPQNVEQEDVYSEIKPLMMGVLEGYKVCILAYGQSGSGKTYTMTGHLYDEKSWGVNPRALHDLFKIKEERAKEGTHFQVSIKMVEIYNNRVRDLFDSAHKELKVRSQGDDQLPDATSFLVNSSDDVFTYMEFGQANRAVGATNLNESSSRSHSVLTVTVVGRQLDQQSCIMGCLQLVDLAGSEKLDQSLAVGERQKETCEINKSLSALALVIEALKKNEEHIPYRNCKLTEVLQGSLAPKSRVLTFIHMRPELGACQETLNTLKFSQRIGSIELGNAQVHTKKQMSKAEQPGGPNFYKSKAPAPSRLFFTPEPVPLRQKKAMPSP